MRCAQVEERLSRLLDQPLDQAERALVDDHLLGCASCAQTWAWMKQARAVAQGLPAAIPSPTLAQRALAAALKSAAAQKDRESQEDFLASLFPVAWRFALGGGVLALAMSVGAWRKAERAPVSDEAVILAPLTQDTQDVASLVLGGGKP